MDRLKRTIRDDINLKWKYYLGSYFLAYVIIISSEEVPSWIYYSPLKFRVMILAYILGTLFYSMVNKDSFFGKLSKGYKAGGIAFLAFMVVAIIYYVLLSVGIDIKPFL